MLDAWQLRIKVGGREERYRFTRPEAAAEILEDIEARLARTVEKPRPERVLSLKPGKVLYGDGWSVRLAPISDVDFLSLPMG